MPVFDPPLAPLNLGCVKQNSGGSTGTATAMAVQTDLGQLPDDSPIDLPLPANASLFGSNEYSVDGQTALIDLDASAPETPAAVLRFYQQTLPPMGWTLAPPVPGGFGSSVAPAAPGAAAGGPGAAFRGAVYCSGSGEDDPWLALWAGPQPSTAATTGGAAAPTGGAAVWAVIHVPSSQVSSSDDPCVVPPAGG
jgi:hypothetical protein